MLDWSFTVFCLYVTQVDRKSYVVSPRFGYDQRRTGPPGSLVLADSPDLLQVTCRWVDESFLSPSLTALCCPVCFPTFFELQGERFKFSWLMIA